MANIQPEIEKIQTATYGEEVRNSFISALEKINSSSGSASIDDIKSNTYTKEETEQLITQAALPKENKSNKVQSISSMSQTFDNNNYPSVTAVRNYVNTKTDDLQDYIEGELDEAKADKADTNAQFERLIAVLQSKAGKAETADAVVRNYKDATPDVTFNMHNTKVDAFLQTEAYDSSDYSYSNLPTADSTNWDRPNTTTITIPSGSSKIVFYDTVTRAERVESTSGTTHTVDNLIPNRNYAYTVRNSSGEMLMHGVIKATGQLRMINAGGDDTKVDRTFNIRDLGGWTATGGKLKYGLVYRGGELNGSISISSAQQAFFKDVLGIRHEIDLRDNGEPGVGATALGCGVNYYHLATGRSPYILWDNDTYAKKRADVIKQLAKNIKNGEPTYIHCQAGADRTGVMCVFLKAICGVSQSDIDRDQELSYYSYQADPQRVRKRNNAWANGHRVMINGTGAENYSQPYINNMEGSSFQDKIVRLLLRSGVTIDELNDIRFGLIDGNPTALTNPYGNATITKNLSCVFIDNEDTSVKLYQPFEARVLPNDGYILTSVSVTMGGTDITSTAYNVERILIPRVTGDIIITASATDVSGKENTSNKVTEITANSTDAQYPSALAVYNAIQTAIAELPTTQGVMDWIAYLESLGYNVDYILGLHADFENMVFSRLGAAVGLTAGQDFNVFPMYGERRRCNVANDGTINAYYGDESYTEDGSNGQVMVYQPVFWYKVVPLDIDRNTSGVGYHIRKANYYVSSKPVFGFKRHPLFYDEQGNPVDYVLLSAYEGSMYDVSEEAYVNDSVDTSVSYGAGDLLCSVAGKKPISGKLSGVGTKANFETMANNRGSGWHLNTIKAESANQLLMLIELGRFNTQAAIGQGVVSCPNDGSYNCSSYTGSTASLGNATGMASQTTAESAGTETVNTTNGKLSVSYRGVENPWGNIWKHTNGINIWGDSHMGGGQVYIADDFSFNESKHDGNYQSAGFTISNGNGYVSAFGYGDEDYDWLFMPSETTGNSSLPVGDIFGRISNLDGYRTALLGGRWDHSDDAGGFAWSCGSTPGTRYYGIGGRLLYVPTATV